MPQICRRARARQARANTRNKSSFASFLSRKEDPSRIPSHVWEGFGWGFVPHSQPEKKRALVTPFVSFVPWWLKFFRWNTPRPGPLKKQVSFFSEEKKQKTFNFFAAGPP
jgi:hypothetical protein